MTKLEKAIKERVTEMEKEFNPYKVKAIKFFLDGKTKYIYNDEVMTEEEISAAYIQTASKDMKNGYEERMVGYYDKWYRYCHSDQGRAYDEGQKLATTNPKCSKEFNIIECQA